MALLLIAAAFLHSFELEGLGGVNVATNGFCTSYDCKRAPELTVRGTVGLGDNVRVGLRLSTVLGPQHFETGTSRAFSLSLEALAHTTGRFQIYAGGGAGLGSLDLHCRSCTPQDPYVYDESTLPLFSLLGGARAFVASWLFVGIEGRTSLWVGARLHGGDGVPSNTDNPLTLGAQALVGAALP